MKINPQVLALLTEADTAMDIVRDSISLLQAEQGVKDDEDLQAIIDALSADAEELQTTLTGLTLEGELQKLPEHTEFKHEKI